MNGRLTMNKEGYDMSVKEVGWNRLIAGIAVWQIAMAVGGLVLGGVVTLVVLGVNYYMHNEMDVKELQRAAGSALFIAKNDLEELQRKPEAYSLERAALVKQAYDHALRQVDAAERGERLKDQKEIDQLYREVTVAQVAAELDLARNPPPDERAKNERIARLERELLLLVDVEPFRAQRQAKLAELKRVSEAPAERPKPNEHRVQDLVLRAAKIVEARYAAYGINRTVYQREELIEQLRAGAPIPASPKKAVAYGADQ
jgi:hypothetical protein